MEDLEELKLSLAGERILATGGSGFISSLLAKTLVDNGAEVYSLDRRLVSQDIVGLSGKVKFLRGNIQHYARVKHYIDAYRITGVLHLAAQAIVTVANKSPFQTFKTNVMGTVNVLEACRNSETVEKVIVASSDKAYGVHEKLPYREDFPLNACFPYDVSKMCADRIAYSYFKTFGLPVGITRLANVYGGGDLNLSRIVPGTMRALLKDENPIIRSDGTPVRDYLYIDDAVNAYLTLYRNVKEFKGEAFNFGTDNPISVLDIVTKMIAASGKTHLKPIILGVAKGEIDRQYLDASKAKRQLGWTAKVGLDEGLKKTYRWYEENKRFLT